MHPWVLKPALLLLFSSQTPTPKNLPLSPSLSLSLALSHTHTGKCYFFFCFWMHICTLWTLALFWTMAQATQLPQLELSLLLLVLLLGTAHEVHSLEGKKALSLRNLFWDQMTSTPNCFSQKSSEFKLKKEGYNKNWTWWNDILCSWTWLFFLFFLFCSSTSGFATQGCFFLLECELCSSLLAFVVDM